MVPWYTPTEWSSHYRSNSPVRIHQKPLDAATDGYEDHIDYTPMDVLLSSGLYDGCMDPHLDLRVHAVSAGWALGSCWYQTWVVNLSSHWYISRDYLTAWECWNILTRVILAFCLLARSTKSARSTSSLPYIARSSINRRMGPDRRMWIGCNVCRVYLFRGPLNR